MRLPSCTGRTARTRALALAAIVGGALAFDLGVRPVPAGAAERGGPVYRVVVGSPRC